MAEERWWLWKLPEGAKYIGKRGIPRKDAKEKASGKTVYCRDIYLPGMVYAKQLNSPYANAQIKSMDTSKAEKLPGVVAVIKWDDPEFKDKIPLWNFHGLENVYLPWILDKAYFYGQPVGAIVVAESIEACDEALKVLQENTQWEELPLNLNWDEYEKYPVAWPGHEEYDKRAVESASELGMFLMLEPGGGKFQFKPVDLEVGDVEKGFREADKTIEFTVRKSEEDVWAGVEAACAIARWRDGHLEAWSNNQFSHERVRRRLAESLKIPECNIEVYTPYKGAHFGGPSLLKQGCPLEIVTALLAKKVRRPVKYLDDLMSFRGAEHHAGTYNIKVGFKNDGTITAVKVDTIYACRGFGHFASDPISKLLDSTKIPNISLHSVYPFVNRNPTVCYKHGAPACTVVTMVINRVATELGMDPTEVALKNDGWEGHDMAWVKEHIAKEQGFDITRDSRKEVIETGKKAIHWDEKWHPPGTKILPNGKYHGIGFSSVNQWHWIPFTGAGGLETPISEGIRVNRDGSVSILGWVADGGVNRHTTYSQVVADEMGMRYEDVDLISFVNMGYIQQVLGSSAGLVSNLPITIRAAREAKRLILEHATQLPEFKGKKPEELDIKDNMVFEKANPEKKVPVARVSSLYTISTWDSSDLAAPILPKETPCMVRQALFVEVEVDPDTGMVDITNVVYVNDVGKAINPDAVNGQQSNGYMGLGRAFIEAIYYDPLTGVKLNDNPIGYSVPLMNDVGKIDCHIVETGLGYGAYGTAGCSECAGALLATIAAPAIYNAIGKWIDDWPPTTDKILKALGKA